MDAIHDKSLGGLNVDYKLTYSTKLFIANSNLFPKFLQKANCLLYNAANDEGLLTLVGN